LLIKKLIQKPDSVTFEELVHILSESKYDEELFKTADEVRKKYVGDEVHLRGIIEFSNYCKRHCLYCGIRSENSKLKRYRMSKEEIIKRAKIIAEQGVKTIVLQSGEDPYYTTEIIAEIISEIKKFNVAVTLSLGERNEKEYILWKESGADRYLMRHETASEKLYNWLHPDSSFKERAKHLKILKKIGYETGAGCMVGLPGQGPEELALDLIFMRELDADMVGIGPFIPHPSTPLANEKGGDLKACLKMIALTRLLIPDCNIPATTAMGSIHPNGREFALKCGANVIMPNLTPPKYRPLYQLYPNKICIFESDMRCIPCVKKMIAKLNRSIGKDFGNRNKNKDRILVS